MRIRTSKKTQVWQKSPHINKGSILLMTLVLIFMGTIGLAIWARMIKQSSRLGMHVRNVARDFVVLSNSREITRALIYTAYTKQLNLTGKVIKYAKQGNIQFGGVKITYMPLKDPKEFSSSYYNYFNWTKPKVFAETVTASLHLGEYKSHNYNYYICAINPILAGNPISIYKKSFRDQIGKDYSNAGHTNENRIGSVSGSVSLNGFNNAPKIINTTLYKNSAGLRVSGGETPQYHTSQIQSDFSKDSANAPFPYLFVNDVNALDVAYKTGFNSFGDMLNEVNAKFENHDDIPDDLIGQIEPLGQYLQSNGYIDGNYLIGTQYVVTRVNPDTVFGKYGGEKRIKRISEVEPVSNGIDLEYWATIKNTQEPGTPVEIVPRPEDMGKVYVELGNNATPSVIKINSNVKELRVYEKSPYNQDQTQVEENGSIVSKLFRPADVSSMSPVIMRLDDPSLNSIQFHGDGNTRPFVLVIGANNQTTQNRSINLDFTGATAGRTWRMTLIVEDIDVNFRYAGSLQIKGGIMTSGDVNVGQNLQIIPEDGAANLNDEPHAGLNGVLPRHYWVESYETGLSDRNTIDELYMGE